MKKFNWDDSTTEEKIVHNKCYNMKDKLWKLLEKYYDQEEDNLSYEEKMIILEARQLINNIDVDQVVLDAYERMNSI